MKFEYFIFFLNLRYVSGISAVVVVFIIPFNRSGFLSKSGILNPLVRIILFVYLWTPVVIYNYNSSIVLFLLHIVFVSKQQCKMNFNSSLPPRHVQFTSSQYNNPTEYFEFRVPCCIVTILMNATHLFPSPFDQFSGHQTMSQNTRGEKK